VIGTRAHSLITPAPGPHTPETGCAGVKVEKESPLSGNERFRARHAAKQPLGRWWCPEAVAETSVAIGGGVGEFCYTRVMALVGYARVSTGEQSDDLQRDALSAAGCERIFADAASGARADRPALLAAWEFLREGDTLVVWRLDRLGRSLPHLLELSEDLERRGVQLRSLTENLDTSSPGGRLIFSLMSALAQFERDLIRERTHAGLAAARQRGRTGGRPTVMTPAKTAAAARLHASGTPIAHIAASLDVSRATVYRWLATQPPAAATG